LKLETWIVGSCLMQQVQIQVPPNVLLGGVYMAQMPDGQQVQVTAQVPGGQMMMVQYQAAAVPMNAPLMPAQDVQMMQQGPPVVAATPMDGFPAQVVALQVPQVVTGIPMDPSMFQTSVFTGGIDPVPMLDAQTAGVLAAVNKFRVIQRVSLAELISQGMCEVQNVYDIFDDATGQPIFTALENSDGCTRCCCAPHHSFFLKFKPAGAGMPRDYLENSPTLMTMEREGCCSKIGLGCCACTDMCKDGFFLHAGDVDGSPGEVQMNSGRVMGFATQPSLGGGFTPSITVMERLASDGSQWGSMAKVEGPCLFGGCSELCCESEWPVSKLKAEDMDTKLMVGDFAIITKKKPKDCEQLMAEALTDSDTYTIEFNPGVQLAPQQKALMLASLMQIDFMFFEQDNGTCKRENGKTKITCFQCYCMGCLCPCNCTFGKNNDGGGAPPQNTEMVR